MYVEGSHANVIKFSTEDARNAQEVWVRVVWRCMYRALYWNVLMWRCMYRASFCNVLMWRCVYRAPYCNVLMTNELHNSYNQFYSTVFCLLYMFRTNLVFHHQKHGVIYCVTQFVTIGTIVQANLDSPARLYRLHNILYYTVQSVQSCCKYDCTGCTV
jgi:hypothetical protein